MTFQEITKLHPRPASPDRDAVLRCIDDYLDCAAGCTSCAGADLAESDVQEVARCIRLCLDCADECDATGPHRDATDRAGHPRHPRSGRSLFGGLPRLCRGMRAARRPSRALPSRSRARGFSSATAATVTGGDDPEALGMPSQVRRRGGPASTSFAHCKVRPIFPPRQWRSPGRKRSASPSLVMVD